jgi:hypothetical protein
MTTLACSTCGVRASRRMGLTRFALSATSRVRSSATELRSNASRGAVRLAAIIFIRLRGLSTTSPLHPCIFGITRCT